MRLAAAAVLAGLAVGCSDVTEVTGEGAYVFVSEAPDGWELRRVSLPADGVFGFGRAPGGIDVLVPADGGSGAELFTHRLPGPPWADDVVVPPLDVDAPDGRAVYEHPYAPDHLVVDLYGAFLEVWGEGASPELLRDLAATVDPSGRPAAPEGFRLVARMPEGWSATGTAVDVELGRSDRRERITTVSLPARDLEAVRLLLFDEPEVSMRTESSVYDLHRYPEPTSVAGGVFGMIGGFTSALVLDGDPGVVLLTTTNDADDALADRRLLASVVPLLVRGDTADLEAVASAAQERLVAAERRRLLADRPVLWSSSSGDRYLVVDSSPGWSGPDTSETRRLRAPCLVVLLVSSDVRGHDGCADPRVPLVSVGEVRTDQSGLTNVRHVFALADDTVAAVEVRAAGSEVLASASLMTLDEPFEGRRRLFVLTYGDEPWVLRRDLSVVALGDDGRVLRRVPQNAIGTFEAQPGPGRR